jgi:outer membrane protein assembly factor BamB/subtilisin family serine protease
LNAFLLRFLAALLAAVALTAHGAQPARFSAKELAQGYSDTFVLAKPRATRRASVDADEQREGLSLHRHFSRLGGLRVLRVRPGETADVAIKRLRASGRYDYVERNGLRYPRVIPNDPSFSQQWSLRNTGASGGVSGVDIGATSAWDSLNDASSVIVAVVDSGIRLTHKDLAANLWTSASGTHGINSILSSTSAGYTNPSDDLGHGTHVAGIIGAVGNNAVGISGIAWKTKLMALKFLTDDGPGSIDDSLECINFAIANGASIINASYGDSTYYQAEYDAIKAARDAGIIVVVAAGNSAANNDAQIDYPSGYLLDNIVAVASTTRTDALSTSSSYGSGSVELGAPGQDIYSTYNTSDTSYQTLSGTSMAAPHVSGALALLRARYPNDSYRQTINRLLRGVTKTAALAGKVQSGGRLNLAQALTAAATPFNDAFADRATLSGANIRVRSNNADATAESGEPAHAGAAAQHSLWWTWTAPETTEYSFDTAGSSYDTRLALYTGTSLGSLHAVASNDNTNETTITSRVVMTLSAGTTLQIAVSGPTGGLTGLRIGSVPANDFFAAAKTVSGKQIRIAGTTLNAARETGEPNPTGQGAGHSVWYKWTAPADGHYSLAAFATTTDTVAAVYTGNSVSNLTTLASNDDNSDSGNTDALVSFDASADTTYYFQIDHTGESTLADGGDFILTLTDSLWEFPTFDEVTSSPAIASDGTAYIGSLDGYVYAINPDGSKKWQYPSSTSIPLGEFEGSSPAIGDDGTIYIGSGDNALYALNGATGARKWSFSGDSAITSAPALASDGTIYFRNETKLYALNPSRTLKWSFTLNTSSAGGTYSSPIVGYDGTIYVGTTGGSLYALTDNGSSYTRKWTFAANGDIYTTPAIAADGTLYFATVAGDFYALTPGASSATEKWHIALPKYAGADNSITSSPALAPDGTIYFAAYDHKLYALNPTNGATKWSFRLGDEVRASSPVVAADGTIFVGAYDGSIYAVSSSGALVRTYPAALTIRSSPAIAGTRLYFGSADAKLHAFELGQPAAASAWPMFHQNPLRNGRRASSPPIVTAQRPQSASVGANLTLSTTEPAPSHQWRVNGVPIENATNASFALNNLQPSDAGIYTIEVASGAAVTAMATIVGLSSTEKVIGSGHELTPHDIVHPNGNVFDQVLLTGSAESITSDFTENQITRTSFIDLNDDIVQVEFSGPGTLSLVLADATGPAIAGNYNQPDISYLKGHAGIVITGADERTNVSVFTVGKITAVNQALFKEGVTYDGIADIAFIAISSANGKFGGVRTSNTAYFATHGLTGLYAPGVAFSGPVYLGNVTAYDSATPVIQVGSVDDARITGGDLLQENGAPVQISGVTRLKFADGTDSGGHLIAAKSNRAILQQNGQDVTAQVVPKPSP